MFATPGTPCAPCAPWSPLIPCAPTAPTAPGSPLAPLSPAVPCAPVSPCGPAAPWAPVGPGGATELCATVFVFLAFFAFLCFFLLVADEAAPCLMVLVAAKALVAITAPSRATRAMTSVTRLMRSLRIRDMTCDFLVIALCGRGHRPDPSGQMPLPRSCCRRSPATAGPMDAAARAECPRRRTARPRMRGPGVRKLRDEVQADGRDGTQPHLARRANGHVDIPPTTPAVPTAGVNHPCSGHPCLSSMAQGTRQTAEVQGWTVAIRPHTARALKPGHRPNAESTSMRRSDTVVPGAFPARRHRRGRSRPLPVGRRACVE